MYANRYGYSDVHPYEVIKQNTERKYTIRSMNSELHSDWKPECHVGGFCCNVLNNHDQKWIITPNEEGYETTIRLGKDGIWKDKYGNKFKIEDKPVRFYDYNF